MIEPDVVMERLNQKQALRKKNYDNGARASSSLQPNDKVRMQVQNYWVPANCSETVRYSLTARLYKHQMEKLSQEQKAFTSMGWSSSTTDIATT